MNLLFQNGEWIFDNLNSITQLGFNVDPPKVRLQKLLLNLPDINYSFREISKVKCYRQRPIKFLNFFWNA